MGVIFWTLWVTFCCLWEAFWSLWETLGYLWEGLWVPLEAFWEPLWHQNRPKFHPRWYSKPYLLQKHDVHENIEKPMKFHHFSAQEGSDNDPKLPQDRSKTVPKAIFFHVGFLVQFCTVVGSVLAPFWDPVGLQDHTKSDQKSIKN